MVYLSTGIKQQRKEQFFNSNEDKKHLLDFFLQINSKEICKQNLTFQRNSTKLSRENFLA